MVSNRFIAAIAGLAGLIVPAVGVAAPSGVVIMICTNVASGAPWKITVDYRRGTVDANTAQISDAEISWHDPKRSGTFTLNRRSGDLTFVGPSSTGGYFLYYRCAPVNPH